MTNPTDTMALEELSFNELHLDDSSSNRSEDRDAQTRTMLDRIKSIASISEVLRIFGACAVIASMSLLMLKGWNDGNDIVRYMKLLGQTGLLTAAGLALSFIVREYKGARMFFGLALISVVCNFTILGSLVYSISHMDVLADYPEMMTWQAGNWKNFLPVFAFAVFALPVLTRFSMSIFARHIAAPLTLGFLALNSMLLIPVRGSIEISALIFISVAAAAYLAKRLSNRKELVLTKETRFALASLFLPGLILISRSLSLYILDEVLLITLSGLAYFCVRALIERMPQASFTKRVVEITQYCLGIYIALLVTDLLPSEMRTFNTAMFSLLTLAFLADQIYRSSNKSWRTSILNLTIISLVICNIGISLSNSETMLTAMSVITCTAMIFFGRKISKQVNDIHASQLSAMIGTAICVFILGIDLIALIDLSNWIVIGLLGMIAIIGASLYERYGLKLMVTK